MGAIIEILGDCSIPREKREEFQNCILHVLDIGGMMRLEEVCKYGKSVCLMTKASEYDEEIGYYWGVYNYFEDNEWEPIDYFPQEQYFRSRKVGGSVYNRVVGICHMLQELYSSGRCYVRGDLTWSPLKMVSWINKEFGTNFDLEHRMDMLKIYRALQSDYYCKDKKPCIDLLLDCAEIYDRRYRFVENSREALRDQIRSERSTEEAEKFFERVGDYVFCSENGYTQKLLELLEMMAELNYEYDFSTDDLLECGLDERLYWWSEGAFDLSPRCLTWLSGIQEKHQEIVEKIRKNGKTCKITAKKLLTILERIDDVYDGLYMFEETYYDMLEQRSAEAMGAVKLMESMCLQAEPVLEKYQDEDDWYRLRFSRPRREMKLYLALLGNRYLRKKTLSF